MRNNHSLKSAGYGSGDKPFPVLTGQENIDLLAERYAVERGGRSGRTVRQFVESLKSSNDNGTVV